MPVCPACGAPTIQRGSQFACTTTNCPANWTKPKDGK